MPLHDAVKATPFPVLEIDIVHIAARVSWRAHFIISPKKKGQPFWG